eukprot:TRINITY_DN11636_c0_g1_i1.p1 TRINITY_DN11636_c0_g1~~TRINITY_DN11636_c0_g1_i1.p1  ORF type:complete len:102 (+),score=19.02 TRINITY_DN11636_c0_g1_i1:15-320(+)
MPKRIYDIFKDMVFILSGGFSTQTVLQKKIELRGGTVVVHFCDQVTHLISTPSGVSSRRFKKAVDAGVLILKEDWIIDSISADLRRLNQNMLSNNLSLQNG